MQHREMVKLEQQGKLLIGVDRPMARKFYIDIPMSKIEEETGERPYFEKLIVWSALLLGPMTLVASIVLSVIAFKWWGIIAVIVLPVVYMMHSSSSVLGRSRLFGITTLLLIAIAIHFFANLKYPWITAAAGLFLFSLWCVRLLYCSSSFLLRAFVIRNARAFKWLSEYLIVKQG